MKRKTLTLAFISASLPLFLLCLSCHKVDTVYDSTLKIDLEKAILKDTFLFSDFITSYEYLELESNENCLFTNNSRILSTDSLNFVIDEKQRKILIFSNLGKFINSISKFGSGKGNYLSIQDVDLDIYSKRILLLDSKQGKILIFDFNTNFIDEYILDLNPSRMIVVNNTAYLFFPGKHCRDNKYYSVCKLNLRNNNRQYIVERPVDFVNDIEGSRFYCYEKTDESVYFWEDFYDYLYCINDSINKELFLIEFSKNHMKKEELQYNDLFLLNWDKKPHIIEIKPSSSYLFIKTVELKQVFYYIYNIDENKLYKSAYPIFNDIEGGPNFWPVHYRGGKAFNRLIDMNTLKKTRNSKIIISHKIDSLINTKSINDNPILFQVNFN